MSRQETVIEERLRIGGGDLGGVKGLQDGIKIGSKPSFFCARFCDRKLGGLAVVYLRYVTKTSTMTCCDFFAVIGAQE